jgi:hypothetical protein
VMWLREGQAPIKYFLPMIAVDTTV